jgi:hypothetical protein
MAEELQLNQDQENKAVNLALSKVPYPHLSGMVLSSDIRINGLTLNTIDENGIVWVCTDIDGWWNLANPEVPDIARGLDDGSYGVRGRWTARSLNLVGSILVPNATYTAAARQQLMEAVNLVYNGGWLQVDETPTKAAFVYLAGQPMMTAVNRRGRIDFSIPLRAPDPIKYEWTSNLANDGYKTVTLTSGSASLPNAGNAPVAAVFELTGPMTAPIVISNTDAASTTKSLRIVTTLRANGFTGSSTLTNKQCSAGVATLSFAAAHGFYVGDNITVTNISGFNKSNVAITAVTSTTISYANPVANISSIQITSGNATVTTSSSHGLVVGDYVYIKDCVNPLVDGAYLITVANPLLPTKLEFAKDLPNQTLAAGGTVSKQIASAAQATGTITLQGDDTMKIDTYNGTVLFNNAPDYSRSTLSTTVDWIKLQPGSNSMSLVKSGGAGTATVKYRSGWIG